MPMKKFSCLAFATILCLSQVQATMMEVCGSRIGLTHIRTGSTIKGQGKSPERPWYIQQEGNVLALGVTTCDFTFQLLNDDEEVVYTVFLPSGTTSVALPDTLVGDYEIRFVDSNSYFYGYITL